MHINRPQKCRRLCFNGERLDFCFPICVCIVCRKGRVYVGKYIVDGVYGFAKLSFILIVRKGVDGLIVLLIRFAPGFMQSS